MVKGKILTVFYSKAGHTRIIGNKIARILGSDVEEIIDLKDRKGVVTWDRSAFNEELRTPTKIKKPEKDPSKYDLVIIGSPIWDGIVPAVEAYLKQNKFKKVAFFSTFNASAEGAFYDMSQLTGKKPLATLEVQDLQIARKEDEELIKEFCSKLK